MLTSRLILVPPPTLLAEEAASPSPPPMPDDAPPAVRLSIQGRHGLFLVQRDADEAIVDTHDPAAPHCTCGLPASPEGGECEHVALLRACGYLARAA